MTIEVTEKLVESVYNNGIDINNFILLKMVTEEIKIPNNIKILGILNLLEKKGITENQKITKKGLELLNSIDDKDVVIKKKVLEVKKSSANFNEFCNNLFDKIKNLIIELTKNKTGQYRNPSGKPLRPSNVKELEQQLEKFIKKNNYKDLNKIEEAILNHVKKCIITPVKYQRTVYYFIDKTNFPSELLNALENGDVELIEENYIVKDTKNLF